MAMRWRLTLILLSTDLAAQLRRKVCPADLLSGSCYVADERRACSALFPPRLSHGPTSLRSNNLWFSYELSAWQWRLNATDLEIMNRESISTNVPDDAHKPFYVIAT